MHRQQNLITAQQQIRHAQHLIELHQNIIDRLKEAGQSTRLVDRQMAKIQAGLAARLRDLEDMESALQQQEHPE